MKTLQRKQHLDKACVSLRFNVDERTADAVAWAHFKEKFQYYRVGVLIWSPSDDTDSVPWRQV